MDLQLIKELRRNTLPYDEKRCLEILPEILNQDNTHMPELYQMMERVAVDLVKRKRFSFLENNSLVGVQEYVYDAVHYALDRLNLFVRKSNFKNWLCTVYTNYYRRIREKYKDDMRISLEHLLEDDDSFDEEDLYCFQSPDNVEGEVMAMECKALVDSVLEQLPEKYHKVLVLRYCQGYSVEETAKIMDTNKKNIENWSARAKAAAKKIICKASLEQFALEFIHSSLKGA